MNTYDFKKLALMGIIGGMMFAAHAHANLVTDAETTGSDTTQTEKNGCSGKNGCKGMDGEKDSNSCAGPGGCAGKTDTSETETTETETIEE
ncbi:MAG: hypothetical protein K940chlam7_02117 [Chlamydiae bacterium]|nr:hypothetical protein [Chlamydiota bacterium]